MRLVRGISAHLSPLTLGAILAALGSNGLSNVFPPKGLNVGQISRDIFGDVLITPASYAFAIWGLIYLALISYGLYQLAPARRSDPCLQALNRYVSLASVMHLAWVWVFTLQGFWLSGVLILGILIPLLLAYRRLGQDDRSQRLSRSWYWRVQGPFSLYLGWISVATIVNWACVLTWHNWQGWGISPLGWTGVMLLIAGGLGLLALGRRRDYTFAGVLMWAYGAIALRHGSDLPVLSGGAAFGAIVLGILSLILYNQEKSQPSPDKP